MPPLQARNPSGQQPTPAVQRSGGQQSAAQTMSPPPQHAPAVVHCPTGQQLSPQQEESAALGQHSCGPPAAPQTRVVQQSSGAIGGRKHVPVQHWPSQHSSKIEQQLSPHGSTESSGRHCPSQQAKFSPQTVCTQRPSV